jgi:hypothetical protein
MAGTFKHRHQTVVPAGGADVDRNEWNDSHIAAGGTDGQFLQRDSAQTDGWKWADAITPPVAGSVVIGTSVATSSPVNLTALGTKDWWAPTNNTTNLHLQTQPYPNRKLVGRAFLEHWWVAGASGITVFTGALLTTISATAADNRANSALAAFGTGALCFNGTGGVTGYGWGMRVKASTVSTVLHFGSRIWSGVATITASLTDGSASTTGTITAGAGLGAEFDTPVTFNAASNEADLIINVILTTNSGSSPHLGLVYGYI